VPDYETLYPGRFLKKETLAAPKVIRITAVNVVSLENDKGQMEDQATLKFKAIDGDGEMTWCKTNSALTSFALDTRDYEKWIGRLIAIAHDPSVMFGGKKVGGIRVFGSPEMKAPKKVEIKMPRKKRPDIYHLVPTDTKGNVKQVAGEKAGEQATESKSADEIDHGPSCPANIGEQCDCQEPSA
jgi:hypothetical protein